MFQSLRKKVADALAKNLPLPYFGASLAISLIHQKLNPKSAKGKKAHEPVPPEQVEWLYDLKTGEWAPEPKIYNVGAKPIVQDIDNDEELDLSQLLPGLQRLILSFVCGIQPGTTLRCGPQMIEDIKNFHKFNHEYESPPFSHQLAAAKVCQIQLHGQLSDWADCIEGTPLSWHPRSWLARRSNESVMIPSGGEYEMRAFPYGNFGEVIDIMNSDNDDPDQTEPEYIRQYDSKHQLCWRKSGGIDTYKERTFPISHKDAKMFDGGKIEVSCTQKVNIYDYLKGDHGDKQFVTNVDYKLMIDLDDPEHGNGYTVKDFVDYSGVKLLRWNGWGSVEVRLHVPVNKDAKLPNGLLLATMDVGLYIDIDKEHLKAYKTIESPEI